MVRDGPDVSFVIACHNASAFLEDAVRSALAQRDVDVDVLIIDDGSTDDSRDIAMRLVARDDRVRSLCTPRNLGPAGARNIGFEQARGRWIAVLDADDLLHPDRSARLIDHAEATAADLIADELLVFSDGSRAPSETFLGRTPGSAPSWIDLDAYLAGTIMYASRRNLGFLKPMFRRAFVERCGLRYDEHLRIAEDDDLVVRALLGGARYRLDPAIGYFYRKHGASISHRLATADAARMRAKAATFVAGPLVDESVRPAFRRRHAAIERAHAFCAMVDAAKARDMRALVGLGVRYPEALSLWRMPLAARLARLWPGRRDAPAIPPPSPDAVLVISRQRLVGATNGSSAYVLALARAARAAGFVPHLLQPSPVVFGRTPIQKHRPELDVFATIRMRRALRVGRYAISLNPQTWRTAVMGVVRAAARKAGSTGPMTRDRKAPYSVAAPWTDDDFKYVADVGRGTASLVVADYMFQTEAFPFLLDPSIRSAIVMHDSFAARADQFANDGTADSVATIGIAEENRRLGSADAVIAIQADEAARVRSAVPGVEVVLAPMACDPVAAPQPGQDGTLLFVGSNTAPNVHALSWFFAEVWPPLRAARPGVALDIAGTVAAAFGTAPEGVRFLGLIDDLDPVYARAGVVISPLQQGSGLKIKLVEALAKGKACVVSGVTLQGVEHFATDTVICADTAQEMVPALTGLLDDRQARLSLGTKALDAAARTFGSDACFAAFRDWLVSNAPVRLI